MLRRRRRSLKLQSTQPAGDGGRQRTWVLRRLCQAHTGAAGRQVGAGRRRRIHLAPLRHSQGTQPTVAGKAPAAGEPAARQVDEGEQAVLRGLRRAGNARQVGAAVAAAPPPSARSEAPSGRGCSGLVRRGRAARGKQTAAPAPPPAAASSSPRWPPARRPGRSTALARPCLARPRARGLALRRTDILTGAAGDAGVRELVKRMARWKAS